jgi:lycopene cyclase domain-containing protein
LTFSYSFTLFKVKTLFLTCRKKAALYHTDKIYTLITATVTILSFIYLHFIAKSEWLTKASVVYAILMLGFFPVNGILTGSFLDKPIVNYNPNEFMGIRMLTIPIEDAVYGYTQFLWVIYFFKKFSKSKVSYEISENNSQ